MKKKLKKCWPPCKNVDNTPMNKLNRNEARKLAKSKKRKTRLNTSKIDNLFSLHSGSRKMGGDPLNGILNLESLNNLHNLFRIIERHRQTV